MFAYILKPTQTTASTKLYTFYCVELTFIPFVLCSETAYTYVTPFTQDMYSHVWVVPQLHSLEFHLRACRSAYVLLAGMVFKTNNHVYEIEIGADDNRQ